jgi:epoxyqueuosine reductase
MGDRTNSSDAPSHDGQAVALTREMARTAALAAGFSDAYLVALPHSDEARDGARFAEWMAAGRAGSMQYLARRNEDGELLRRRTELPFPWARSAIVCLASYNSTLARSTDAHAQDAAWIARYAWSSRVDASGERRPSDYHKVLKKRLEAMEARLRAELGATQSEVDVRPADFEMRGFVDTGPVLERALATAAGLGWTGKNTCLLHPRLGSFGFLAVLLTALPVSDAPPTAPANFAEKQQDRCGTCTRCIDACPTGALIAPRQMDATRCISYLTIEHKGAIDESLLPLMGRQIFGCDICQDVCPWNRKAAISADPELESRTELVNPLLDWLAALDEAGFEKKFNGSPVRRAGFRGLQRNVAIAMGNSGQTRFAAHLAEWTEAADEGLRTAARWALGRLSR